MKKIILLALLAIVSVSAFARKSYITVTAHPYSNDYYIQMTGDVPNGILNFIYKEAYHYWETDYSEYTIGEVLNILSEYGYEVESMAGGIQTYNSSSSRVQYLLSKEIPSNQTVTSGDVNKDGRVNVSDIATLVNIILGIVRDNPSLLEQNK